MQCKNLIEVIDRRDVIPDFDELTCDGLNLHDFVRMKCSADAALTVSVFFTAAFVVVFLAAIYFRKTLRVKFYRGRLKF
jgi:hypothetical protein